MNQKTALWIRFDIPYGDEAKFMKGVMGIKFQTDERTQIITIIESNCADIPETIEKLLAQLERQKISMSKQFTLVFPLDPRHNLAWIIKEAADKRDWEFLRQIPKDEDPDWEYYVPFFMYVTGSPDDTLSEEQARENLLDLNEEARDDFASGMDLLDAIGKLRHALQLAWQHFGWEHFSTVFTLRNLIYVYMDTQNPDNERESWWLLHLMVREWEYKKIKLEGWNTDSVKILESLKDLCEELHDPELAKKIDAFIEVD